MAKYAGMPVYIILPPEMICLIISNLTIPDIHKLRQVDHWFKSTIDNTELEGLTLGPMSKQALDTINNFIAEELSVVPEGAGKLDAIVAAFQRFCARHPNSRDDISREFSYLWQMRCTGSVESKQEHRGTVSILNLILLIDLMHHPRHDDVYPFAHRRTYHHTIDMWDDGTVPSQRTAESKYADSGAFCDYIDSANKHDEAAISLMFGDCTAVEWTKLYTKLQHTPNGLFSGVNRLIRESSKPWPGHLLTGTPVKNEETLKANRMLVKRLGHHQQAGSSMFGMDHDPMGERGWKMATKFGISEVVNTLGVPAIPNMQFLDVVAYSMRSKLAYDLFSQVVDDKRPMTPLLKHFLLRELYLI